MQCLHNARIFGLEMKAIPANGENLGKSELSLIAAPIGSNVISTDWIVPYKQINRKYTFKFLLTGVVSYNAALPWPPQTGLP